MRKKQDKDYYVLKKKTPSVVAVKWYKTSLFRNITFFLIFVLIGSLVSIEIIDRNGSFSGSFYSEDDTTISINLVNTLIFALSSLAIKEMTKMTYKKAKIRYLEKTDKNKKDKFMLRDIVNNKLDLP